MLQNQSIKHRIGRFLTEMHPFCFFNDVDIDKLTTHIVVSVYTANQYIFHENTKPEPYFYIVKKGAIDIIDNSADGTFLIDKCGEGDMFGIRPILAESPYLYDSICVEDAIIYEIPITLFREIYHNYPEAIDYMIKRFAAGASIRDSYHLEQDNTVIIETKINNVIPFNKSRSLISTSTEASIQRAIQTMHEHSVSSIIIIDKQKYPIGILTDRDIRRIVATDQNLHLPVKNVMSAPVRCIAPHITLEEIQLTMIDTGLHHLCVTTDGTGESEAIGMMTEHDILYASATDPIVILKKIKKAKTIEQLTEIRTKIDLIAPNFVSENINRKISLSLIDKLNRTLIAKVIELCLQTYNLSNPKIETQNFFFYNMGSAARGEQVLMTDQDNGIVYIDEEAHRAEDYHLFATMIVESLEKIGYEKCPANMMVSNPDWCTSMQEMKEKVHNWVMNPGPEEVLSTSIFFDFRYEYGNETMAEELKSFTADLLSEQDIYIRFLAKQAILNPPPLSFFRKIIIEKDGAHKDHFDIKLRAMSPLSDCARVLTLDIPWMISSNTYERFQMLKEIDPGNVVLYDDAAESYLTLLSIKVKHALMEGNSGRFIDNSTLSKMEKINLRRCFNAPRKLLDMIERKYKLGYL